MFYRGHSTANDDLNAPLPDPNEKRGYQKDINGDGYSIPGIENAAAAESWTVNGGGEEVKDRWRQAGTNPWDRSVDRYRNQGEQAQGRQAVQLDQTDSSQSRGIQMGALGLLGQAADGRAPSRAAAVGQMANDTISRQAVSGLGAGRGPAGSVMAMRNASGAAAQAAGRTNAGVMDLRSDEMAKAQQAYVGAAQQARGQDIQTATTGAQLEAQQRALNEQKQQQYERLGWETRKTQQQAADDFERLLAQQDDARRRQRLAEDAQDDATTQYWASTTLGGGLGLIGGSGSDERMKRQVLPMGSLGHLLKKDR